ncbi:unnamed protein product [Spirodela intermedia]|uniref:Uncharacterized protein n=2 Tax=Spirodela intermedia TaxID=51605 RepID=A0A7I8JFZ9_SPIIN|nr:unnamed protein product [Spirodela intermedia]CAA6668871.1 unnamed protein product [Spirodela intermedia]CAA7405777.1 unnamed protein product [Spirodela intermedia]
MGRLLRAAEEEVPGTLMSLKLSAMEISELTRKLSSLRQRMPRSRSNGRKDRTSGQRAGTGGADSLII